MGNIAEIGAKKIPCHAEDLYLGRKAYFLLSQSFAISGGIIVSTKE